MKQKSKTPEPKAIKFWKNNLISNEHSLTKEQLIEKFKEWLPAQTTSWLEYYYGEACIKNFIAISDNGILSTFEQQDFSHIYNWLMPILKAHMDMIDATEANQKK